MSIAVSPIVSVNEILAAVAAGRLTPEKAAELIPSPQRGGRLWCKVSPKRAISIYGLQRMPVTLYAQQWERLLAYAEEIRKFIAEHKAELSYK